MVDGKECNSNEGGVNIHHNKLDSKRKRKRGLEEVIK